MFNVLIIEDDPLYVKTLQELLHCEFKNTETKVITSENQFQEDFLELEAFIPDLIVLDIMLRWTNAKFSNVAVPAFVKDHGFYRSGFRCLDSFANSDKLRDCPVIIHSMLSREELENQLEGLPANVFFVNKDRVSDLVRFARSVVHQLPDENPDRDSLVQKVLDSSEVKPSWFGLSVDLKSLFRKKGK